MKGGVFFQLRERALSRAREDRVLRTIDFGRRWSRSLLDDTTLAEIRQDTARHLCGIVRFTFLSSRFDFFIFFFIFCAPRLWWSIALPSSSLSHRCQIFSSLLPFLSLSLSHSFSLFFLFLSLSLPRLANDRWTAQSLQSLQV